MRPGDVIVAIDDEGLASTKDFLAALEEREPGQDVTLRVVRDGEPAQVRLTLGREA